jgi:hypothetical protein
LLEFNKKYSPLIHGTGSEKPNESPLKSLARRHLLYFSLILAKMVSMSGQARLKTTSLRCRQMHQNIRIMAVHRYLCVALGQGLEAHH